MKCPISKIVLEASIFEARYQIKKVAITGQTKLRSLPQSSETEFERLFKDHFKSLYSYAFTIIKDEAAAEEIVQNVFYKIWEKNKQPGIQTSVTAYLYKAVYHDSLNYLKHLKVRAQYKSRVMHQHKEEGPPASGKLMLKELEEKLRDAMNSLPEQCRTIFQMSRFDGLKYQDIASELGISVKTVENQMGKALKLLRVKLIDFLPLVIFSILNS
jgi:RNA polymerase sigma-70 factor, ECF subfamily